ncbi:MAG TPA: zinc ribbon domain-containing protein [Nitrosopumilaceae archaeon]|nr:zinc ribbon domain-containing protein [Nitrosopumilaceae archaeon]
MDNFSQSLLKRVEDLLNREVGDISRLMHIKESVVMGKKLYNSDIQYVEELQKNNPGNQTENFYENHSSNTNSPCWKCGKDLIQSASFCSFCGTDQNQKISDFEEAFSRRIKREYNPIKIISNFHSYQLLAVVGGFASLIPILIGISNIERILEIIEFYTGEDLSEFSVGFMALGVVSGILCSLVIVVPFWIKKPKKVGKFLFFSSFGILIFSIMLGVVGFVIILFAGVLALKKRRY